MLPIASFAIDNALAVGGQGGSLRKLYPELHTCPTVTFNVIIIKTTVTLNGFPYISPVTYSIKCSNILILLEQHTKNLTHG
jgi:hypothetical protein